MYRSSRYRSAPRRFGGFRRRRFGPRLRPAKEPARWEVGQFFFGNIINITDAGTNPSTIVTSIAQIEGHLGDAATSQGRALDNIARSLEIGGMVFRYEIVSNLNAPGGIPENDDELTNRVNWRVLLVSDRLDSVGQPVSIPNWFNVTTPVVAASSTAVEDLDNEYPTRIHWQNFHGTSWSNRVGGASAVAPQTAHVDNRRGGANLRLRLRLDDNHGLFLHFAQQHSSSNDGENVFVGQLLMTGTIYYRFRF